MLCTVARDCLRAIRSTGLSYYSDKVVNACLFCPPYPFPRISTALQREP